MTKTLEERIKAAGLDSYNQWVDDDLSPCADDKIECPEEFGYTSGILCALSIIEALKEKNSSLYEIKKLHYVEIVKLQSEIEALQAEKDDYKEALEFYKKNLANGKVCNFYGNIPSARKAEKALEKHQTLEDK